MCFYPVILILFLSFSSAFYIILFYPLPFESHNFLFCLLLSEFLHHLLPLFFHIFFPPSLLFTLSCLPSVFYVHYFMFFSFILKVVSVFCYPPRFYHTLIPFLLHPIFRFSLSSFLPSLLLFHAFYTLFLRSFLPFFCYSMLTFLCPPSQFHLGVPVVFAFTPAKAFVRELKCPAITRLAGSITCRVTQFLRGSLLSLSLTIRGPANELAPHRFYARFCRVP